MGLAPLVLVDEAVLSGAAHSFPLHWLEGLRLAPYVPRKLASAAAKEATAAIVRSMTNVDAEVLHQLPQLAHVATLSSGTDHLDLPLLANRGVVVHTGRGGNARAVADWCDWALHRMVGLEASPVSLQGKRVLVVGVGAVGSMVARLVRLRGAEVVVHDPPRQEREPDGPAEMPGIGWTDVGGARGDWYDAVTLHVPLTKTGPHPTYNWLSGQQIHYWTENEAVLFLQASRGGVLNERSARKYSRNVPCPLVAIDTFCREPQVELPLVRALHLATPHIAGHSAAGKLDVARRALQSLRLALGCPAELDLAAAVTERLAQAPPDVDLSPWAALDRASQEFRLSCAKRRGNRFDELRHNHLRQESAAVGTLEVILP